MPDLYKCPCCEELLGMKAFMTHFKSSHADEELERIVCNYCRRPYNDICGYYKHLKTKHPLQEAHIDPTLSKTDGNVSTAGQHSKYTPKVIENENMTHRNKLTFEQSTTSDTLQVIGIDEINAPFSFDEYNRKVEDTIATFVAELYSHNNLTRKFVQDLIGKVSKLTNSILTDITFQSKGCRCSSDLSTSRNIVSNAFSQFSTEHKSTKYFQKSDALILPYSKDITCVLHAKRKNKKQEVVAVNLKIECVPLKQVLTTFLQLPNVYSTILNYIEKCESSNDIISPMQGERWKDIKSKFINKRVLPIALFIDDFGVNNPLGSHRNVHKLGGVYFSLLCIPEEFRSMLENIFLAQIYNTKDYEKVGNKKMFAHLIDQLAELEEKGIVINIENKQEQVHFVLLSMIADNLAQHSILGFTTSFNAIKSCRICSVNKDTRYRQTVENPKILRNRVNYDKDVKNTSNGVNEECVFNVLLRYHVTENVSVDYMHDLYEGVCQYVMLAILKKLINEYKFFDIETLNWRIACFDHGSAYGGNKPVPINKTALSQNKLTMSASEMRTFVEHFGFYVGDLVEEGNAAWKMYLLLRKILYIVTSPSLSPQMITDLKAYISEHHALWIQVFNESLKPKFHNLIHYPRLMLLLGPLRFFSSMRYEGKHRPLKTIARTTTSRMNPAHTIAVKHQQNLCYRFHSNTGFSAKLSWGALITNNLIDVVDFDEFNDFIPESLNMNHPIPSWVSIYGTYYEIGQVITIESTALNRIFGKIMYIAIGLGTDITFIYRRLKPLGFLEHVQAFEIGETEEWGHINHKSLIRYQPFNIYKMSNDKQYVPLL